MKKKLSKNYKRNLVFDLQCIQGENLFRGIGIYITNFLDNFLKNYSKSFNIYLFLNGNYEQTASEIILRYKKYIPENNFKTIFFAKNTSTNLRHFNTYLREYYLNSLKPDLIVIGDIFLNNNQENSKNKGFVFTHNEYFKNNHLCFFYDIIPHIYSQQYLTNKETRFNYYNKLKSIIDYDAIASISDTTTNDLNKYFNYKIREKTFTISYSSNNDLFNTKIEKEIQCFRNKEFNPKQFILCVSGADYRKNIDFLIHAYLNIDESYQKEFPLVLCGRDMNNRVNWKKLFLDFPNAFLTKELDIPRGIVPTLKNIKIMDYVSDSDLVNLLSRCSFFVFPSLYEGGGLPVLEALSFKKLVICSNISVFSNLVNKDYLFDPYNSDDLQNKIIKAIYDFKNNSFSIDDKKLRKFRWVNVSKNFLEILNKKNFKNNNNSLLPFNLLDFLKNFKRLYSLQKIDKRFAAESLALNFRKERLPRIYVDISELIKQDHKTGIQRVVNKILHNLNVVVPSEKIELIPVYSDTSFKSYYAFNYLNNLNFKDHLKPIQPQDGDIFLGLDLCHHIALSKVNYYKKLKLVGVKVYFVVYDLLPIQFPHFWPKEYRLDEIHKNWLDLILNFDGLLAISKTVKNNIRKYMAGEKIISDINLDYFPMGSDIGHSRDLNLNDIPKFLIAKKSINFLMVGTIEPRKGHIDIIQAMEILWQKSFKNINLIIVGKRGWLDHDIYKKIIESQFYNTNLFYYENADDDFLNFLYSKCSCLIAASYDEGYGLPIIEAAAHKLNVIARNIPVFKEVGKNYISYSNMTTPKITANSLLRWISSFQNKTHAKIDQLKFHTWEESTKVLFKKLISSKINY